jgi:hypothetical protein
MYSDKKGSTNDFHRYLRRRHRTQYLAKRNVRKAVCESESDSDSDVQVSTYDERINELINIDLIVKCNLLASMIEQPGFRHLMKLVAQQWKPSSARSLSENEIDPIIV